MCSHSHPHHKGFYHSDKPLVQQALADELSSLILLIPSASTTDGADAATAEAADGTAESAGAGAESSRKKKGKRKVVEAYTPEGTEGMSARATAALAFVEGFWDSIVREWPTLDKHR